MKRKPVPPSAPAMEEPVVAKQILDIAKKSAAADTAKPAAKCVVCSDPCAPNSNEGLCWVCRRLKISAWRDSDMQMGAQE
jgi:hypothetical protein